MDYKYIEQLLERYWEAETTLEEESILRAFFSQANIPAEMEYLRPLFTAEAEETLGDDFDARILLMTGNHEVRTAEEQTETVVARRVSLKQRLMPLFKAAAVVAIILTLGGALQAPWDNSWNEPQDYAAIQQELDSMAAVKPIQAENMSDIGIDSAKVLVADSPKNYE